MKIKNIIENIEALYPLDKQSSWDNSGVQIGNLEEEVKGIYIALDAEIFHVKKAIELGANFIITHHPLIFGGIKSLTHGEFMYEVIALAMKHKLTIYATHTPFDQSEVGMKNSPLLKFGTNIDYDFVLDEGITFGTLMDVEPNSFEDCQNKIVETLEPYGLTHLTRAYKANDNAIKKVAIMGGSGAGYICDAKISGADLYITADVKYHDIQLAKRLGLNLIDLSHDQSEIHFVDIMSEQLLNSNPDLDGKIHSSYKTYLNF